MLKKVYRAQVIDNTSITYSFYDEYILSLNLQEERSWSSLGKLGKTGDIHIHHLIVLDLYGEKEKIKEKLKESDGLYDIVSIIEKPDTRHRKLPTTLNALHVQYGCGKTIAMDISCIPTPHFYIIMKYYKNQDVALLIQYTEPQDYIIEGILSRSYQSMTGPVITREIMGYSGITVKKGSSNRLLICILGFDNDVLPLVVQEAVPEKLIAVNGFPPVFIKYKDFSLINNEKLLFGSGFAEIMDEGENRSRVYYADAKNPFEMYNLMEELARKYSDYCIDVVPLSTKPMALGVCIYALEHEDVRILFPFPEKYEVGTSYSDKDTWEYIIDTA